MFLREPLRNSCMLTVDIVYFNNTKLYNCFRGEGPLGSVSGFEGMGIYRYGTKCVCVQLKFSFKAPSSSIL